VWLGTTLTLLAWGLVSDRVGERAVLALGLGGCAAALVGAATVPPFGAMVALLALAGAAGAAVNSASGRAVMHWFGPEERGLALGVRQSAIPIGGLVTALVLPSIADARGLGAALLFLAALCLAAAVVGALVVRERRVDGDELAGATFAVRDARLWTLSFGSSLYLIAQSAVLSFGVLFLHDARGFSPAAAAAVLAAVQVLATALRIGAGMWSDRLRSRLVPLRRLGVAIAATLGLAAALVSAPSALLVPALVVAGGLGMSWNGLSFAAAAELAGRARSGAAIGFQQTALSLVGVAVSPAFGWFVETTSWRAAFALASAFPLVGIAVLATVDER
jgi:sugar phosphate permease